MCVCVCVDSRCVCVRARMHICWYAANNPHLFVLQCNGLHKSHHILLRDLPLGPLRSPLSLSSSLVSPRSNLPPHPPASPPPHTQFFFFFVFLPDTLLPSPASHLSHFSRALPKSFKVSLRRGPRLIRPRHSRGLFYLSAAPLWPSVFISPLIITLAGLDVSVFALGPFFFFFLAWRLSSGRGAKRGEEATCQMEWFV